jgi:uncharacterized protein involved in cysteine biosynthesis
MLQPLIRAVSQLSDPVFLGVTVRSLLWSLAAFVGVCIGVVSLSQHWVGQGGWWYGWIAGLFGVVGAGLLAIWLYVPVALLIATLYVNQVADAVERRFYPALPPARGAPLLEQGWDGTVLATQILGLQVLTLVLTLILPGVGLVLGYLVTGWAIGRGLFVSVAMRRAGRAEALALYRQRRVATVAVGVLLALAGLLPPLNLLVPVVGIAAMVHVLHESRALAR